MASLFSSRKALLRLPPAIRASAYQHGYSRPFSASTPRKNTLVDLAVTPPTYLLDALHSLGFSWTAIIPLSAVIVRGVVVYYFSALPSQKAAQVQSYLIPLASVRSRNSLNSPEHLQEEKKLKNRLLINLKRQWVQWRAHSKELAILGKQFGAPRSFIRPIFNFGMLIAMTEAIRMKCGSREGLLPLVLSPVQWLGRKVGVLAASPGNEQVGTEAQDEALAKSLQSAVTFDDAGNMTFNQENVAAVPAPESAYAAYFDPSLQSEGLLWCTDLTIPDPMYILPAVLWLAMSANIMFRPTVGGAPEVAKPASTPTTTATEGSSSIPLQTAPSNSLPDTVTPAAQAILAHPPYRLSKLFAPSDSKNFMGLSVLPPQTIMQRIGLWFACGLGYAAMNMPAGILLYFIPSLAVGWLQRRWLNVKYPIRQPIRACKKPLRLRVRSEAGWQG